MPITGAALLSAQSNYNYYCEGQFSRAECGYPWLAFLENMSQLWAMYCLVRWRARAGRVCTLLLILTRLAPQILFYQAYKEELKDVRPLAKFMCIKVCANRALQWPNCQPVPRSVTARPPAHRVWCSSRSGSRC